MDNRLHIRKALGENYKDRRRILQQQRREQEAEVRTGLTKKQEQVALRILELTNGNHDAAALWISLQRNFSDCSRKDVHARFSFFLQDKLTSSWASNISSRRTQESIEEQRRNIQVAQSFVQGAQLAQWVREQNVEKGLAPPSRHLIHQMECNDAVAPLDFSASSQLPVVPPIACAGSRIDLEPLVSRKYNKRVQKWRKKWNVRLARIRGRETPSTSEITKKVPRRTPNNEKQCRQIWVKNGPHVSEVYQQHQIEPTKNGVAIFTKNGGRCQLELDESHQDIGPRECPIDIDQPRRNCSALLPWRKQGRRDKESFSS